MRPFFFSSCHFCQLSPPIPRCRWSSRQGGHHPHPALELSGHAPIPCGARRSPPPSQAGARRSPPAIPRGARRPLPALELAVPSPRWSSPAPLSIPRSSSPAAVVHPAFVGRRPFPSHSSLAATLLELQLVGGCRPSPATTRRMPPPLSLLPLAERCHLVDWRRQPLLRIEGVIGSRSHGEF